MHHKAAHFTGDLHLPRTTEAVNGCFVTVRECARPVPPNGDETLSGLQRAEKHKKILRCLWEWTYTDPGSDGLCHATRFLEYVIKNIHVSDDADVRECVHLLPHLSFV